MTWKFKPVIDDLGRFTEGPAWDGEGLYFSHVIDSKILKYVPGTDQLLTKFEDTEAANGLKFGPDGNLYACKMDGERVDRYERDGSTTVVADSFEGTRLNAPNDLAFDAAGNLWFTNPQYEDFKGGTELNHASVHMTDVTEDGGETKRMTYDTTKPNGILVSEDQQELYVAEGSNDEDHNQFQLRAYQINGAELGAFRTLHTFHPHRGIDGMCLDSKGNIIGCAGNHESGPGPLLYVFNTDGRVLETHPYPNGAPTNCTFGGDDLSEIYVTDHNGGLYRAETNRTGIIKPPANPFP
jgi:gluconolactonase